MPETTDPTRASSAAFNRRAFVGMSAATAAGGTTIAAALAQGAEFGKPHPPIVPEDDPALTIGTPAITYGGRTITAYAAGPKGADPAKPAVVVVQAIWGVDAQLRDTVRRFAKLGYEAIAPDLYSGLDAPSGDGTSDIGPFRAVAGKLADAVVDADLAATAAFLRSAPGAAKRSIGLTGFCMGGGIVLRQTVDNAKVFGAAAVFYGKVRYGTTGNDGAITPIALAYADELGVPLAGSWGARDTSILSDDVRALEARLTSLGKPRDFRVYDNAGHAFFDDTRASYVPDAASDAWTRTLAWFKLHLA
jgi:carboxymethylenebutenolidase